MAAHKMQKVILQSNYKVQHLDILDTKIRIQLMIEERTYKKWEKQKNSLQKTTRNIISLKQMSRNLAKSQNKTDVTKHNIISLILTKWKLLEGDRRYD